MGGEKVTPSAALAGGIYISPAVFVDVRDDMRIAREVRFRSFAQNTGEGERQGETKISQICQLIQRGYRS